MADCKLTISKTGHTQSRNTSNSQFKCCICTENMCYSTRGNLKRHMLSCHVPNYSKVVVVARECRLRRGDRQIGSRRYFCPIHCAFSNTERWRVVKHIHNMHRGMEAFPPFVQHVTATRKQRENVLVNREHKRLGDILRNYRSPPKFRIVSAQIQKIMRENVQDFVTGGFWASPRDLKEYLLSVKKKKKKKRSSTQENDTHRLYDKCPKGKSMCDRKSMKVRKSSSSVAIHNVDISKRPYGGWKNSNMHTDPVIRDVSIIQEHPLIGGEDGSNKLSGFPPSASENDVNTKQSDFNLLQSDLLLSDTTDDESLESVTIETGRESRKKPEAVIRVVPSDFRVPSNNSNTANSTPIHDSASLSEHYTYVQAESCVPLSSRSVRPLLKSPERCPTNIGSLETPMQISISVDVDCHPKPCETADDASKLKRDNLECHNGRGREIKIHKFPELCDPVGNSERPEITKHPSPLHTIPTQKIEMDRSTLSLQMASQISSTSEYFEPHRRMYTLYNSEKVECWISRHADFLGNASSRWGDTMLCSERYESESKSSDNNNIPMLSMRRGDADIQNCHSLSEEIATCTTSSECSGSDISEPSENLSTHLPIVTYSARIVTVAGSHVKGTVGRPRIRMKFRRKSDMNGTCIFPTSASHVAAAAAEGTVFTDGGPSLLSAVDCSSRGYSSSYVVDLGRTFNNSESHSMTITPSEDISKDDSVIAMEDILIPSGPNVGVDCSKRAWHGSVHTIGTSSNYGSLKVNGKSSEFSIKGTSGAPKHRCRPDVSHNFKETLSVE